MKKILEILIVVLLVMPGITTAKTTLQFGVYTSDKPSVMVREFKPVIASLEQWIFETSGEPAEINMQVFSSYELGIKAITEGSVDFARLGPASYVLAKKQNPNIGILAMESINSGKTFKGIICVREDSPIQKITELRGKSFAFGDQNSTIGRFLSQSVLLNAGLHANDLSFYEYLGRHDKVGEAVNAGQYDAGALKEGTFKKLKENGAKLRRLIEFENVTKPWVHRNGLPDQIRKLLQQGLYAIKSKDILKVLKQDGFIPGEDSDYQATRLAIEINPQFFE